MRRLLPSILITLSLLSLLLIPTGKRPVIAQVNCNNVNDFCQHMSEAYEAGCAINEQGGSSFYDSCYCKGVRVHKTCLDQQSCGTKSIALILATPGCFQVQ